jgi:hypothetical protein
MCATTETPAKHDATLNGLPEQLKKRVLQHLETVFDEDEEDEEHSHSHEHSHEGHSHGAGEVCGEEEDDGCGCGHDHGEDLGGEEKAKRAHKATLSALSRVNKEWYGLVAPEFWKVRLAFPILSPVFF